MPLEWDRFTLYLELMTPILGTIAKDPSVWEKHQKTKFTGDDEHAPTAVDQDGNPVDPAELGDLRGWSTFYTEEGTNHPIMYAYQVRGLFKEAGEAIKPQLRQPGKATKDGTVADVPFAGVRSAIDRHLFIEPRYQVLAEKIDGYLERPLRAQTPQGPRVTVVRSDRIDPPKNWEWQVKILKKSKINVRMLEDILEYAELQGLGQWRTGGFGQVKGTLKPQS